MEIKINIASIDAIRAAIKAAALATMEAVKTDVIAAQVVPFDTGKMQNSQFTAQTEQGDELHTTLTTDADQARKLYFHPEYNFQRGKNANAGAGWYDPWVSGEKADFAPSVFAEELKERLP